MFKKQKVSDEMPLSFVLTTLIVVAVGTLPLLMLKEMISWHRKDPLSSASRTRKNNKADVIQNSDKLMNTVSLAEKDAKKDEYTADLVFSEQRQKYETTYKKERMRIVKRKAKSDALQRYKFENGQLSFEPVMQGGALTVPAEIAIYQVKFVEEKSRLEKANSKQKENNRTLNQSSENDVFSKSEFLQKIYKDDTQEHLDQGEFYSAFAAQNYEQKREI